MGQNFQVSAKSQQSGLPIFTKFEYLFINKIQLRSKCNVDKLLVVNWYFFSFEKRKKGQKLTFMSVKQGCQDADCQSIFMAFDLTIQSWSKHHINTSGSEIILTSSLIYCLNAPQLLGRLLGVVHFEQSRLQKALLSLLALGLKDKRPIQRRENQEETHMMPF